MIELCEIDKENWAPIARMELPDSQRSFVASNALTIAESKFYPANKVFGIFSTNEPVGLIAFCKDSEFREGDYWIFRLMVSSLHQKKGYGSQALHACVEKLRNLGALRVIIMCDPKNHVAYKMYRGVGFTKAGVLDDGDSLLELIHNKSRQQTASAADE